MSELTSTKIGDVHLGPGPHVYCHGKGRKDRATPLTRYTVNALRVWLAERSRPARPRRPAARTLESVTCVRNEPVLPASIGSR